MKESPAITTSAHPWLAPKPRRIQTVPNTLEHRVPEWIDCITPTTSEKTRQMYSDFMRHFSEYLSLIKVSQNLRKIGSLEIKKFGIYMLGTQRVASSTAALKIVVVKLFFKWAEDYEYVENDPARKVPNISFKPGERKAITSEEYVKLKQAALESQRYHYMHYGIVAAWHLGLRLSDVATLLKSEVDLEGTPEMVRRMPIKTQRDKKVLEIPIEPTELYPLLKSMLEAPVEPMLSHLSQYVCPQMASEYKAGLLTGNGLLSYQFSVIAKKAGVVGKTFHCNRHSFCSRMINAGVDVVTVSSMSGHSDLSSFKRYAHVSSEAKVAAMFKANQ